MKRLLVVVLAVAASFAACALAEPPAQMHDSLAAPQPTCIPKATKVGIISDLDDTFRMTNVVHFLASGKHEVFLDTHAFAGMSALYAEILKAGNGTSEDDLYFVSGSPQILNVSVDHFLKANHTWPCHLVDPLGFKRSSRIAKFKEKKFEGIFTEYPSKTFIFLGDDTQQDPDALAYALDNFKDRVVGGDSSRPALYIHRLQGKMAPKPGETGYTTALEVALYEMAAGRMSQENVRVVANATRDDANFDNAVVPTWGNPALCPTNQWISTIVVDLKLSLDQELLQEIQGIESRVDKICTERSAHPVKHSWKPK